MSSVRNEELRVYIEPILHDLITEDEYPVETIDAIDLLTCNRFDLAAKLLFIEGMHQGTGTFEDVYLDHIRAFTLGTYKEPGNDEKHCAADYLASFRKLYQDIQQEGFREDLSLIPLASDGSILNGAHRVAIAISLGLQVSCVRLESDAPQYDYSFFRKRLMPESMRDLCAIRFQDIGHNCFIALVWPVAKGHLDQLQRLIPRIVYYKEICLSVNGFHNLLATTYGGEAWLGERAENYPGLRGKLASCYAENHPLRLFMFQADSLAEVLEVKNRVRALFCMGKHSIHINDTEVEAQTIARSLLNQNAIHFLNHAKPKWLSSTWAKIDKFKQWSVVNQLNLDDLALDGGMVLSAYGIRRSGDIDYLSLHDFKCKHPLSDINSHNHDVLTFHRQSLSSLLQDSRFHFWFDGVKFIAFEQVLLMKTRRADAKDKNDVTLMRALVERNFLKFLITGYQQRFLYAKLRVYVRMLKVLQSIGLYEVVRSIYRKVFK